MGFNNVTFKICRTRWVAIIVICTSRKRTDGTISTVLLRGRQFSSAELSDIAIRDFTTKSRYYFRIANTALNGYAINPTFRCSMPTTYCQSLFIIFPASISSSELIKHSSKKKWIRSIFIGILQTSGRHSRRSKIRNLIKPPGSVLIFNNSTIRKTRAIKQLIYIYKQQSAPRFILNRGKLPISIV